MIQRFGFQKTEYGKHPEAIANKYTMRGMTIAMTILCLIWLLNALNVFMVDRRTIGTAATLVLLLYGIGVTIFGFMDLRKPSVKYIIISWVFTIVTVLTTFLTFHAYLVCVLISIYCSMYSSKKMIWWGYALTVLNISITVYAGYSFGICDANMALMTGKPLAEYIGENGQFLLTEITEITAWELPLFFIVPRSLTCLAITLSCSTISRIIRNNIKYAQELESLAEIDEMTGVYNRNKYLSMTPEGYAQENEIAVIFWDINYLKQTNDTLGHEQGDLLIKSIAGTIRKISNQFDQAYRIGGDEFVMIMRGGNEISVKKKIQEWEYEISKLECIGEYPISASYGYAYGAGAELEDVIHRADQMMYENKRKFHDENENKSDVKGE